MNAGAARRGWTWLSQHSAVVLLVLTASGLATGLFLHVAGASAAGNAIWAAVGGCGAAYALWAMADALRHGRVGVDVIALLAVGGAVAVGELLAAAVISVMLASGRALEAWAAGRARRDLHALLERAPRTAHQYRGQALETVPLDVVMPGDLLLVAPGELVPVDGTVVGATAVLDESALTGEARPVERAPREPVRSGVVNAGGPFNLRVTATAADSTYAGIVRLVSEAEASQAPFVRLADRYAVWFLLVSLTWAGAAWLVAGATRAVAVLVVATPCPLILAAPVALVSGLSMAARRGVVVKGGGVLERLARCTTLLLDKTGTLTSGRPEVSAIIPAGDHEPAEILWLAASLDQVSVHVLARAVVEAASARGSRLVLPQHVEEVPGQGIRGTVGARHVAVGRAGWAGVTGRPGWVKTARRRARLDGAITVFVAVDGTPAGVLIMNDPLRPDAARTIRALRDGGIGRIVLVTGDRAEVAHAVGTAIGVDEVLAERAPADKLDAVRAERDQAPVIMVGDGINDAPALALADVGVAMGARGSTASSEAADAVLTVDRLDRLGEVRALACRTRRIAMQSVLAGMGMSVAAMAVAAAGLLPAVWGALLQEAIDVAVILNALRVLIPVAPHARLTADDAARSSRFSREHLTIWADIERLRAAADALGVAAPRQAMSTVRQAHELLVNEIGPHEKAEQEQLYPMVNRLLGTSHATAAMSRTHAEIAHQTRRLGQLIDDIGDAQPDAADIADLRALLYGLHAILSLHTAQEDESYLCLGDAAGTAAPAATPGTSVPGEGTSGPASLASVGQS
ncbi:MAG TPA: heavy metal translocating P-type ATPase [Streptosporangiaceae bacterium]|nr:heavy metal translocating P-type ATPase [Streptosporangiaceae bacterium]